MTKVSEQLTADLALVTEVATSDAKTLITPVYNVKGYGALGDGATNDTSVINSVIADALANDGLVWFAPGTYIVDSAPEFPPHTAFLGRKVTFKQPDGTVVQPTYQASTTGGFQGELIGGRSVNYRDMYGQITLHPWGGNVGQDENTGLFIDMSNCFAGTETGSNTGSGIKIRQTTKYGAGISIDNREIGDGVFVGNNTGGGHGLNIFQYAGASMSLIGSVCMSDSQGYEDIFVNVSYNNPYGLIRVSDVDAAYGLNPAAKPWNVSGDVLVFDMNNNGSFTGKFADFRTGGVSRFWVDSKGQPHHFGGGDAGMIYVDADAGAHAGIVFQSAGTHKGQLFREASSGDIVLAGAAASGWPESFRVDETTGRMALTAGLTATTDATARAHVTYLPLKVNGTTYYLSLQQ